MREKFTVIISSFNNKDNIKPCPQNLKCPDELLIVGSYSTDRTIEICREYTSRVIQQEYINSVHKEIVLLLKQRITGFSYCTGMTILKKDFLTRYLMPWKTHKHKPMSFVENNSFMTVGEDKETLPVQFPFLSLLTEKDM